MSERTVLIYALIPLLAACDADIATVDSVAEVSTASVTEIALPEVLRTVAALDPDGLQLRVTVNDTVTVLEKDENEDEAEDRWTGSVNVPMNQSNRVVVEWGADHGTGGYIKLAEQQRSVFVGETERTIEFNSYNTSFDDDSDTRTNLTELEQNRSPVNNLDVTINTDGTFGTGGVSYPSSEVCGQQIPIAVRTRPTESDHEGWWCATLKQTFVDADGILRQIENLEITVHVNDDLLWHDSGTDSENTTYHDDSIEIYIDGDDNKRGAYDGLNDFQFRFAPLEGGAVFTTSRGPYAPANLNGTFDYGTGYYVLTATIPLNEVGIRNGFPFGFNVDVNDDDDGGDRDAKYSWIGIEGSDLAWRNTAAFGTTQVP